MFIVSKTGMNTVIISNVIQYGVNLSSCKYSLSGGVNYYFPKTSWTPSLITGDDSSIGTIYFVFSSQHRALTLD